MNNNIKKLTTLAFDTADYPAEQQYRIEPNAAFCEKFAELIIKECIDSIREWRDATDAEMDKDPHWQGYRSGCDDSIVEIQMRFGVEE